MFMTEFSTIMILNLIEYFCWPRLVSFSLYCALQFCCAGCHADARWCAGRSSCGVHSRRVVRHRGSSLPLDFVLLTEERCREEASLHRPCVYLPARRARRGVRVLALLLRNACVPLDPEQ